MVRDADVSGHVSRLQTCPRTSASRDRVLPPQEFIGLCRLKRGLEHHRDVSMDLEAVGEMGRQLTEVQKGCREECVQEFLGVSKVGSFVRDTMACRNILGEGEDW